MKSSLGKIKRFAFPKTDAKERREFQRPPKLDQLAQASQEMQDMRNCYDSLLSAAAATASSAYEFSEDLREMGVCLLEKAELYKDDESKRVFMMLGNVQFELRKLLDLYRSYIFLTITNPSESLLNELQTVQEMKKQCDEKRSVYEYMIAQQREKGRSRSGKGDGFSSEQLQQAHNEYEEEATLCLFRLKSLKQGQSRSLLTQAARHHTAQLNLFRKGLKSLEAVDPHVKLITEKQHIDYEISGLDDGDNAVDEGENSYDSNDCGELSFDYRQHKQGTEAVATSRNTMELDEDQLFPRASTVGRTEFSLEKVQGDSQMLDSEHRASSYSHSAPIIADKKFDQAERITQLRPSRTQKFLTYALPTPGDAKSCSSSRTSSVPRTRPSSVTEHNIWHSLPLDTKMQRDTKEDNKSLSFSKVHQIIDERDTSQDNQVSTHLPPLADGLPFQQSDTVDTSDHKKLKRQAFSGPLSSNLRSRKPGLSASGPISVSEFPPRVSGPTSQALVPQPSSPKTFSRRSPPSVSPPKISELHELPRPPGIVSSKTTTSSSSSGISAPLMSKNLEFPVKNRSISVASNAASPLPIPPLTMPRSYSIPSSHCRAKALNVKNLLESSQLHEKDIASPPLTPTSVAATNAVLTSPKAGTRSSET